MGFFNIFSRKKAENEDGKSSQKLSLALAEIFTHKTLNDRIISKLEDLLIVNDIGVQAVDEIILDLKRQKFGRNVELEEIKSFLVTQIAEILQKCQKKLDFSNHRPQVLVFNGVNGAGKTTSIGKIAFKLKNQNKKILIAACDTFRSAAVEQLQIWANRVGCDIIKPQKNNEDPASVAYRALKKAREEGYDILLIDTAGRMHNKKNLMDELQKINNVLKKLDSSTPHENLIILDGTSGQNAKNQLEIFNKTVGITGLIINKLDGTAKAGFVVALAKSFAKPIYFIGVGEKIEDLQDFKAENFAKNLVGTENELR